MPKRIDREHKHDRTPEPQPQPSAAPSATTLAGLSGTVQTKRPNSNQPYGVPWGNVARWEPSFTNAVKEFPVGDPGAKLMAAMAIVESDANQYRSDGRVVARDDGFGDGLSVGMMQVKPRIWQSLVPNADPNTPDGNIRLGTAIMSQAIKQHGSWQKALTTVYFPANDPNGTTQNAYVQTVTALIAEMEKQLGAQPAPQPQPSNDGAKVAAEAQKHVGQGYEWGASGPSKFDCSGLVAYCIKTALGVDISHDSHAQFALGTAADKNSLQPGDVLCYDTASGREVRLGNRCSHVGIYVGDGKMVNALNDQQGVIVSDPFSAYFAPLFLGARRNIWKTGVQPKPEPKPETEKQFPFAPWPKGFDRRIVTKIGPGHGYDAVTAKRGDRLTHMVVHHTAGGPGFDKDACWRLFSIGGEREAQALTEGVLNRDGTGYLFNDPWSDNPNEGSGRSPWASGPANALSGAGAAFVAKYGVAAVNDRGFAIEHCHADGERWSDAMLDLGAKVYAVVLTRRRIAWDTFPKDASGLWIGLHHDDFANTSCPQMPADVWKAYIEAIRGEMKKLQEPGSITPPGPPPPVEPDPEPVSVTVKVADAFGTLTRHTPEGLTKQYPFDPKGAISLAWLARARKANTFPPAIDWWDDNGWQFVSFGDDPGNPLWLLGGPTATRATLTWLDSGPGSE